MSKKNLIIIIILFIILIGGTVTYCILNNSKDEKNFNDALRFKEEYESLNGTTIEQSGKEYREISIPEENPFVYKEAEDIVDMINNKETFVIYFGFNSCPWCRSVVPTLIEVAKDLGIDTIYYVDVKEIRDTLQLDENGNIITATEGTEGYYQLIELLSNVLSDYQLTDTDGNTVSAEEKRIYAPNVISVVDGTAQKLDTGISEKQTDGYMELTDEMKEDIYNKFSCVLKCVTEEDNSCSVNEIC